MNGKEDEFLGYSVITGKYNYGYEIEIKFNLTDEATPAMRESTSMVCWSEVIICL